MLSTINSIMLFSMPGGGELILIVIVVLLLFGGKKIPELMKGIGKGMREFKDAKENLSGELEKGMQATDNTTIPSTGSTAPVMP